MRSRTVVVTLFLLAIVLVGWWIASRGGQADGTRSTLPDSPERETVAEGRSDSQGSPATNASIISALRDFVADERDLAYIEDVDVQFLDEATFLARLEEEINSRPPDEIAALRQTEKVWRALRLIEPDVDLLKLLDSVLADAVLGFYDPETDEMVVRGDELTPYVRSVLVHELVHALEDQHFDLHRPELDQADDESSIAFAALVEGSATIVENAYIQSLPESERQELRFEEATAAAGVDFGKIPESVLLSVAFPYLFGEFFVDTLVADGSLDAAFTDPPVTSEQIMNPFAFAAGEGRIDVEAPVANGEIIDEGTFGALGLLLLSQGDPQMFGAVDGWGGDRYVAWEDDTRTCVRLAVVGDTPIDTDTIHDALQRWAETHPDADISTASDSQPVILTACI